MKRNNNAYAVKDPNGKILAYGSSEKAAWHNFYLKEKKAGRTARSKMGGNTVIPFGFQGVPSELRKLCGI